MFRILRSITLHLHFLAIFLTFNARLSVCQLQEREALVNQNYTLSSNINTTEILRYNFSDEIIGDLKSANLRLEVEIHEIEKDENCPLLVAAQKGKEIISWEMPFVLGADSGNLTYNYGGRTLCIDPTAKLFPTVNTIFATCNEKNITFSAVLKLDHDFITKMWEKVEMSVSPSSPRYYKFEFPDDIESVIIKVNSDSNECMILSIQKPMCPVFDLESNIQFTGYWQTVTYKTGVTVEKRDFPSGFIIVFSVSSKDEGCRDRDGYQSSGRSGIERSQWQSLGRPREKFVRFVVERALHQNEYVWPTFLPLVSYIPFLIVTVVIFYVSHNTLIINSKDRSVEKDKSSCCMKSAKYMRDDIDEVDNYKLKALQKKSTKYITVMITIAVFYCIPVFQLIISYLNVIYRTGEHDVCYYNNLCSHPLDSIMDFNHIYSNIGYVILGPIFMIFVALRQRTVVYRLRNEGKPVGFGLKQIVRGLEHGTYQHFGLFYSLGFALFMEGFLSAGYHICPNRSNFQFDTSFMYAMAMLSYIKIYQFRHPLHMSESLTFISLAAVATCVVFGLLTESTVFNVVVSVLHVVIVILVQFYLAYDTRARYEKSSGTIPTIIGICKELFLQGDSTYLGKSHPNIILFWWTVFSNLFLISFTWIFLRGNNFAT